METKKILVEYKDLSELKEWDKNPRGITFDGFERLKRQILKFGLYKPFLINEDNIILGGNMRYKACKALEITKVPVTVVSAKTEKEMLEYALSDNDKAGFYEDTALAEIVYTYKDDITLEDYNVDLGKSLTLDQLLNTVAFDKIDNQLNDISGEINKDDSVISFKISKDKEEWAKKICFNYKYNLIDILSVVEKYGNSDLSNVQ